MWWKELLFTGLYSGYCPIAPGTAGTIIAFLLYVLEYCFFGEVSWIINLLIVLSLIYPSIKLCDTGEKFFKKKDPSEIVLDEIFGYWISVLFYPFNWKIAILAFFLFRAFDILKPYPVNKFDRLPGGFGIMMDDVMAGIYSNISILSIILLNNHYKLLNI